MDIIINDKDKEIELLKSKIEKLEDVICKQNKEVELLNNIKDFVSSHVSIGTRGKYDSDYTLECIKAKDFYTKLTDYATRDEKDKFIHLRDTLLSLGAAIEEGHIVVDSRSLEDE